MYSCTEGIKHDDEFEITLNNSLYTRNSNSKNFVSKFRWLLVPLVYLAVFSKYIYLNTKYEYSFWIFKLTRGWRHVSGITEIAIIFFLARKVGWAMRIFNIIFIVLLLLSHVPCVNFNFWWVLQCNYYFTLVIVRMSILIECGVIKGYFWIKINKNIAW